MHGSERVWLGRTYRTKKTYVQTTWCDEEQEDEAVRPVVKREHGVLEVEIYWSSSTIQFPVKATNAACHGIPFLQVGPRGNAGEKGPPLQVFETVVVPEVHEGAERVDGFALTLVHKSEEARVIQEGLARREAM